MHAKQASVREYNFPDSELKGIADSILSSAQRDGAELALRGVTAEKINMLQAMSSSLADIPTDEELAADISQVVAQKEVILENLRVLVRSVRTMAQNSYTANSPYYRCFHFEGMDDMRDEQLYFLGKRVMLEALDQLDVLSAEGLTTAMLDQVEQTLEGILVIVRAREVAEKARLIQTQLRIDAGNALYRDIIRLCNTARDIWASTNEAKYNDYIIYNTAGSHKPATKG
jgi:hypothetical protein